MPTGRQPSEVIAERLAVYLGPHTARNALRTFCQRSLGIAPESMTRGQVPQLLDALRPALRTLLGSARCELILEDLAEELRG